MFRIDLFVVIQCNIIVGTGNVHRISTYNGTLLYLLFIIVKKYDGFFFLVRCFILFEIIEFFIR